MTDAPPSTRTLRPTEIGGQSARRGFHVQDHVAAGFCLKMCESPDLTEVWCETQDDITLYWDVGGGLEEVEFVQVKSDRLGQLWSISRLTSKEQSSSDDSDVDVTSANGASKKKSKKQVAKSILEKSLQMDRGCEKARFRVVTCRPVMDELKVLTFGLDSAHRNVSNKAYNDLLTKLTEKLADARSPKGNNCEYWAKHTHWEVIHEKDPIEVKNILKVIQLAQSQGQIIMVDQARTVYERLLTRVRDAGLADWDTQLDCKVFKNAEFVAWFKNATYFAAHPSANVAGKTLEDKLNAAAVAPDIIETARSLRLAYLGKLFTPRYSDPDKREELENDIDAKLMRLRAKIDSGETDNDGPAFHNMCLDAVEQIHEALPVKDRPPISNLIGFMYNLADRCTHRFVRAKP